MSLATSLLTRGYINTSDSRSLNTVGYVGNEPLPPVVSDDYCPVPVRVRSTTTKIRSRTVGTDIRVRSTTTKIKKRC